MSTLRYLFFTLVTFLLLHIHKMFHERHQRTTTSDEDEEDARREKEEKKKYVKRRKTKNDTKQRRTREKKLNTKEKNVGYNFKSPNGVWLCGCALARARMGRHMETPAKREKEMEEIEKKNIV